MDKSYYHSREKWILIPLCSLVVRAAESSSSSSSRRNGGHPRWGMPGARKARVELAAAQRAEPEVGTVEENSAWLLSLLCFSELPRQAG